MTTVQYTSRRGTKLYFTLGATLTIVLIVSMLLFPGPWSVFIYTAAASLAGAAVLMFTMGCANIYHRIKMQQIERQQARYFASHHHQNVFYDGQLLLPATLPASRAVIEATPETVNPATMPRLLDVLHSWQYPIVFVGPQQSGKTNSAIASAAALNLPILFIGLRNETKYHCQNMTVYSEERRAGSVARGIAAAMAALTDYTPQVIFIDDLINIGLLVDVEPLIVSLATQAMAHKKRVYFTVQATDKASMGLAKYGAQLKTNFALLEVPPPIKDANLRVIGHNDIATLYEPGDWKNGEAVRLPGPVSFAPVDSDAQFLDDYYRLSKNELCAKYYGPKNGPNWDKLNNRLHKHGLLQRTAPQDK